MLQFNHSAPINSNAVYPNVTASVGTSTVLLDFTQSYDFSTKGNVVATLINTVGPLNPWLVFQVSGSAVPTASGQYNVNIWEYNQVTPLGTWGTQATLWVNTKNTWNGSGEIEKIQLLSTERAFVSGTNGYNITQYLLPADGGKYTTYNHP